jgi:UDP-N-acetylglucosamine 2-epimerase (non-hydrolysing)
MRRVAVLMGTRPEAIKMAPVIAALRGAPDLMPVVIATGQHRELLRQVVELFGIEVDHNLDVMAENQSLAALTARLLREIDAVLERVRPDMVLVQGDTSTVLCGGLAAFYRRIPIGHVEAGLRTDDIWSPFPEEANRRLVCPLVTLHFAPTERCRQRLLQEGVPADRVTVTGNTVIDALHMELARQREPAQRARVERALQEKVGDAWRGPFVLVTGHRRESFGEGFRQICRGLARLAERFADHAFIYPVHLNPNVNGPVRQSLAAAPNVRLLEPLDYRLFVALMERCRVVLTDSGGVQEEAPALGKPVLVMRDTTERPEGIEAGVVRLVGAREDAIVEGVSLLLTDEARSRAMSEAVSPYGDGHAAQRVVTRLREWLLASGGRSMR